MPEDGFGLCLPKCPNESDSLPGSKGILIPGSIFIEILLQRLYQPPVSWRKINYPMFV